MKKIYYLLAVAATALFSACNPLDKTYKQIGDLPAPTVPAQTITLTAADYKLLPKGYPAQTALYFKAIDTAKVQIPLILSAKFPAYPNKTSVTVTYATAPLTIQLVDSVYSHVAYTLKPEDYTLNGGATTYTDFSATQIITWLGIKYPAAAENQLAVLAFDFYDQGVTTTGVQQSFLFKGGAWTKLYTISPAQYNSIGKGGKNNDFVTADAALLPTYFNAFLKADPAVYITAKAGDVKYVSFKYYQAATGSGANSKPAVTSQRVIALTYNGTNWTTIATAGTIIFVKTNDIWVADNTINFTLTTTEYKYIADIPNIASDAATGNLRSFGDFNIQGGATSWTEDQINKGIITWLAYKYTKPEVDQLFVITYLAYNGANQNVTKTFTYDGTIFKLKTN